MKFFDTNLIKDLSLLLHAIHNPFYWRILKKPILFSGFENTYNNKIAKQENSSLFFHEYHFVERKNEDRKPEKDSSEKTRVYATKNYVQEFHLGPVRETESMYSL